MQKVNTGQGNITSFFFFDPVMSDINQLHGNMYNHLRETPLGILLRDVLIRLIV